MDLATLVSKVRELTYDKFPIPILYVKSADNPTWVLTSTSTSVRVMDGVTEVFNFPVTSTSTIGELVDALIAKTVNNKPAFSVAQTFAYKPELKLVSTYPFSGSLSNILNFSSKNYVTEEMVKDIFKRYLIQRRIVNPRCNCIEDETITSILASVGCFIENHIYWWVSYFVVEQRRLSEMANNLSDIAFTTDADAFCGLPSFGFSKDIGSIDVSIADVFKLNIPDVAQLNAQIATDKNAVGQDNLFGDAGFWWKLQQYLRVLVERDYQDYSLRPDQILNGQLHIVKDSNQNAYFDTFPYEIYTYSGNFPQGC
jgi:hypothetical protein